MDIPNSFIYLGILKVHNTPNYTQHYNLIPLYITDQRAIADLEEHRIIQAAKIKENTIRTTPATPFVTQLPFTTPFNPTPAPHIVSHFSTPTPFHPTPHHTLSPYPKPTPHNTLTSYPKPTPHNALPPYSKPIPHNSLSPYPKPTPIKPYPTPHSLPHSPNPTPIKPYPTPHTLTHYPKPTPIKPYPTPIKPNSILPPYDTPSSLPIRFPNKVHGTPKPHFEPTHFIFPQERSIARPLPLERAKNQRGFAHDFFSTPRKTSLVRGYYFEQ